MNLPPTTCHYCDRAAVAYCDFVVRRQGVHVWTCDRAICSDHLQRVGFICFRGRNKKASDTVDHCKEHNP